MEELILALFMPPTYYDAWSLRNAMKVLCHLLCIFYPILNVKPHQLWQFTVTAKSVCCIISSE